MKIFRVIFKTNLGTKGLAVDLTSIRNNPCIQKLIELKENKKFITKTSQIIIVSLSLFRMMLSMKK